MMPIAPPQEIHSLIARGALFVVADSGGKDSQAMKILLHRLVPLDQLVIVHCGLHGMEWPGTVEHVHCYAMGIPVHVVQARLSLLDRVEDRRTSFASRGMDASPWPSPALRWCTSDLKRGPIEKFIRHHLKGNPRFAGLVVDCVGLRSEESPERTKRPELEFSKANSKAGREWYDWRPIKHLTEAEVFAVIRDAGQEPHWVYQHMRRCSCCFCIYASEADIRTAAALAPDLFRRYADAERMSGKTLLMPTKKRGQRFMDEIVEPKVDPTESGA